MAFDDFVREITPVVQEIVCGCIEMSAEAYQEYKCKMEATFRELEKPWIMSFWGDIFSLIESYRGTREEAATCKE